jgi:DNA sulfur modification protein DndD
MNLVSVESLEIEDFGPFYGKHKFVFSRNGKKSTTLIGGKNGAGKTHLLRALYLATVGEPGRFDLRKIETGEDCRGFSIENSLNRRAQAEGKNESNLAVTLVQTDQQETSSRKLHLKRTIRFKKSGVDFKSTAKLSDQSQLIESDEKIVKLRDAFLPRHLAQFFFFDAERIQSIALNESDVVEGISKVLGLHNYLELEGDLKLLISSKIPKTFGTGSDAERRLVEISGEISKSEQLLNIASKEKQEVLNELKELQLELGNIETELRSTGAVDPAQLAQLHNQRDAESKKQIELQSILQKAWEKDMPLALLGGYKSQLVNDLVAEEARRDWESRKLSVEPRIPAVQTTVFENPPSEFLLTQKTKEFYETRLRSALEKLFDPPPEKMAAKVFVCGRTEESFSTRSVLNSGLSYVQNLQNTFTELESSKAEIRDLNQKIASAQQSKDSLERGTKLREQRAVTNNNIDLKQRRLKELEDEIIKRSDEIAERKREETNFKEQADKINKGKSLISMAYKYRDAISEIRLQAAVQLRSKISSIVSDLWLEITGRKSEWSKMVFDERWKCDLQKKNGKSIDWEDANPSAGQRQVRILAFTEALRQLAKLIPPLIVDTPLGRLDKEVRESVLNKLYLTGHQSIILSTNSEIDPESDQFNKIANRIGKCYTLVPKGDPESPDFQVHVDEKYFGKAV